MPDRPHAVPISMEQLEGRLLLSAVPQLSLQAPCDAEQADAEAAYVLATAKSDHQSKAYLYDSSSVDVSIPDDGGWVYSSCQTAGAPAGSYITSVEVYVEIIHPWIGDLQVDVDTYPFTTTWTIHSFTGGSNDNIIGTFYNDSDFDKMSPNQTWDLWAVDAAAGYVGYIDYWEIRVYYEAPQQDLPDLTGRGPAYDGFTPASIAPGEQWSAWMDVQNGGPGNAGSFLVSFYASQDSNLDSGEDFFLGQVSVPQVQAGGFAEADLSLASFPAILPGDYYVGAVIDAAGAVAESNECNNAIVFDDWPLTVAGGAQPGDGQVTRRALLIDAYGENDDIYGMRDALLASAGGEWTVGNITMVEYSEATVANTELAISSLAAACDQDDLALIYFTCHGGQAGYDSSPVDEPDGEDGLLAMTDGHIWDDTLGVMCSGFATPLRSVDRFVLIVDACHSEEVMDGSMDPAGVLASHVVMSASQTWELASGGDPYSELTTYLIEAMTASAALADLNGDCGVSAEEALAWADACVSGQDPAISDAYVGGLNIIYYAGLRGDLDDGGFVGQSDLDIVLDQWGSSAPFADGRADVSNDDFVGQSDLDVILDNWGQSVPLAQSSSGGTEAAPSAKQAIPLGSLALPLSRGTAADWRGERAQAAGEVLPSANGRGVSVLALAGALSPKVDFPPEYCGSRADPKGRSEAPRASVRLAEPLFEVLSVEALKVFA